MPTKKDGNSLFLSLHDYLTFSFKFFFFNLRNPNGKCSQTNLKPSIACDILVELIFILGKKENQLCCIISNNLMYFSILLNYWDYSWYTANFDSTPWIYSILAYMRTAIAVIYWVTQKLPQICTVILRICVCKVAWFAVYICGNFWVTQYKE